RGVSAEALDLLQRYDWPGNVRQLENAVFRAVVLADEAWLTPAEFPHVAHQVETQAAPAGPVAPPLGASPIAIDGSRAGDDGFAFDTAGDIRPLSEVEARVIQLALSRYQGRIAVVARKLGIGRSTLYRKLKELGLEDGVTEDIAAA